MIFQSGSCGKNLAVLIAEIRASTPDGMQRLQQEYYEDLSQVFDESKMLALFGAHLKCNRDVMNLKLYHIL